MLTGRNRQVNKYSFLSAFLYIFKRFYLFYFLGCGGSSHHNFFWVFPENHCCTWVFSSWGEWGLLSSCSVQACLQWFLLGSTGSRAHSLQYLPHVGSVVVAPGLWSTGSGVGHVGLVVARHVGSWGLSSSNLMMSSGTVP